MIFLYYKDKMEKIDWEGEHDYLVTRYGMLYYYGKVPDRVKDYYLTDKGVYETRIFMQRLYEGDFYFKIKKKNEWGITHYYYYFGLNFLQYFFYFTEQSLYRLISFFHISIKDFVRNFQVKIVYCLLFHRSLEIAV